MRFEEPLEHPRYRWLVVDAGESPGFPASPTTRELDLPAVGETVRVPGVLPF